LIALFKHVQETVRTTGIAGVDSAIVEKDITGKIAQKHRALNNVTTEECAIMPSASAFLGSRVPLVRKNTVSMTVINEDNA
jgi:hypothetical protein